MSKAEQRQLVSEFRSIVLQASTERPPKLSLTSRRRPLEPHTTFDRHGVTVPLRLDLSRRRMLAGVRLELIPNSRDTLSRVYVERAAVGLGKISTNRELVAAEELSQAVAYVRSPHLGSKVLEALCVLLPEEEAEREAQKAAASDELARREAKREQVEAERLAWRAQMSPAQRVLADFADWNNSMRPYR